MLRDRPPAGPTYPPTRPHLARPHATHTLHPPDGRVERDDDQRLRHVDLGQQEDAHDGVVLDPVVLGLQAIVKLMGLGQCKQSVSVPVYVLDPVVLGLDAVGAGHMI